MTIRELESDTNPTGIQHEFKTFYFALTRP